MLLRSPYQTSQVHMQHWNSNVLTNWKLEMHNNGMTVALCHRLHQQMFICKLQAAYAWGSSLVAGGSTLFAGGSSLFAGKPTTWSISKRVCCAGTSCLLKPR